MEESRLKAPEVLSQREKCLGGLKGVKRLTKTLQLSFIQDLVDILSSIIGLMADPSTDEKGGDSRVRHCLSLCEDR